MRVYRTIKSLQEALSDLQKKQTIGFVPTMGALHQGHISLVKNAKKTTDSVVVSIFVNPTQFDKKEDLINYPTTLQADIAMLNEQDCDFVFIPSVKEMYQKTIKAVEFNFEGLDKVMEGTHREGHFNGVGTVVKRLFDIVKPTHAFFGEKDFQQLQIIRKMVENEKLDVKIIGNAIYREPDGLAMSSRNTRLTKEHRKAAPFIYKTLQQAKSLFGIKNAIEVTEWVYEAFKKQALLEIEYFTIANESDLISIQENESDVAIVASTQKYRAFIAVFAGDIRLIDNIALY